ncbi:MAG: Txe/YoeB family addiction module toxin [Betaproteobacteria bacterium]|nr:Txe/YoeB family addiction module toxin [Betaproteobacteria bacterium]
MKLIFSEEAWEDYLHWQKTDKKILERIHALIKDIARSPFEGIGKPEPLKHALAGYWSRRTNDEHRIVYKVADGSMLIAQLRYHY